MRNIFWHLFCILEITLFERSQKPPYNIQIVFWTASDKRGTSFFTREKNRNSISEKFLQSLWSDKYTGWLVWDKKNLYFLQLCSVIEIFHSIWLFQYFYRNWFNLNFFISSYFTLLLSTITYWNTLPYSIFTFRNILEFSYSSKYFMLHGFPVPFHHDEWPMLELHFSWTRTKRHAFISG